jgi:iron complex outermembrane receptor protein
LGIVNPRSKGPAKARAGVRLAWVLAAGLLCASLVGFAGQVAFAQAAADDATLDDDLFGDEDLGDDDLFDEEGAGDDPSRDGAGGEDLATDDPEETAVESVSEPVAEPFVDELPATGGPTEGVEEILVQGQATSGLETDATVSVTQFNAEDLEALGVSDISDVAKFTPNLEIRTGSATAPTFFIRGIGLNDFTANASGAIAIYQDDVALSLPAIQLGQLFDVDALEVLRGPQGHGAARNASGGAIKIYSRKPTGEIAGNFKATFGRFDQRDFEGALEVPLLADVLSGRVAFIVSQRDTITQNRCAGAPKEGGPLASQNEDRITSFRPNGAPNRRQPAICNSPLLRSVVNDLGLGGPGTLLISDVNSGLEGDLDDIDRWAARAQLRFAPPDTDMEWLLNVHGGKIDQFARTGQTIGTVAVGGKTFGGTTSAGYRAPEITKEEDDIFASLGGVGNDPVLRARAQEILAKNLARRLDKKPFEGDFNRTGKERQSTYGGFLRGDLEFGWAHLTSISALERYDRHRNLDADYTSDVIFEFIITDRAWQFNQEFLLEGELDEYPVRWNAGVYYVMDQLDYDSETVVSPPRQSLVQIYDQKTWSLGAYGGLEWDFLDDFTLEGGIRFNWERKSFDIFLERGGIPNCGVVVQGALPVACQDQQTWQDPSGIAKLSYHFTEEVVAYASYSRGFKSGQYSVGGASGDAFTVADRETVDSFEVGLKGSVLDGMLEINAAAFHYTYDDYQVFLAANDAFTPPQRVVVNANDAVLYGAELEAKLIPFQGLGYELLDGFRFESRLSWIESEFLDFTQRIFRQLGLTPGDVDIEWTGNRLPNTPRFKWSGTVEYQLDLGEYGSLIPRWDMVWTDDSYFDASDGRGIPDLNGKPVLPEFAIGQPAYWLHNVRLAWRSASSQLELAFWVRNVTNEVYKTLAFDASEGANLVGNQVGDPRTYGVTLSLSW